MVTWRQYWNRALGVAVTLVLVSCGRSGASTIPTSPIVVTIENEDTPVVFRAPEELHRAWVAALQENDRQTLLTLADASIPSAYIDSRLNHTYPLTQGKSDAHGAFNGVEVLTIVNQGKGKEGYSLWHFAKRKSCYGLEMAETADGWRVTQWGEVQMKFCVKE